MPRLGRRFKDRLADLDSTALRWNCCIVVVLMIVFFCWQSMAGKEVFGAQTSAPASVHAAPARGYAARVEARQASPTPASRVYFAAALAAAGEAPTATVAATCTPSPTDTALPTATATDPATPTVTPTATPLPATPTMTFTPTVTLTPTETSTPAPTDTATPIPPPTATATPLGPDGSGRKSRVPILMYHHIADPPAGANRYETDLSVSPATFEAQLAWLQSAGYQTVSLRQIHEHLMVGTPLPANPIAITFDDGYVDNYTHAWPALRAHGFSGSFFVITDFVDQDLPDYMTWPQIEEMAAAGMEIGSHSRTHLDLRRRSYEKLVWELLGSRETLEAHVGPVFAFSYPAGEYDQFTLDVLRSAGYCVAVCVAPGATHSQGNPLELARVRVRRNDSLAQFQRKLALDW